MKAKLGVWWDGLSDKARYNVLCGLLGVTAVGCIFGGIALATTWEDWRRVVGIIVSLFGGLVGFMLQTIQEAERKIHPLPVRYVSPPANQEVKRVRCAECSTTTMSNEGEGWVTMQHAALQPMLLSYHLQVFHLCPRHRHADGVEKLAHPRTGIHLRPVKEL